MGRKKREFNRLRLDSGQHRRIMLVSALLGALAFLPVGLRLYSLMVTNYDYYSSLALRNQTRTTTVTADRGGHLRPEYEYSGDLRQRGKCVSRPP